MKYFSDRIKMALSGMLAVSLLASCSSQAVTETTQPAVPESSPSTEASVSESETTEEETSETSFTVETEEKNNPLLDYAMSNPSEYALNAYLILCPTDYKVDLTYGFDNLYTVAKFQGYVSDVTGIQDSSLSLSDVSYFQYTSYFDYYSSVTFTEALYTCDVEAVRAVLISQGLRFGIDEIPASYIQERFPMFCYDAMAFNRPNKAYDETDIVTLDPATMTSIWDPETDLERDFKLFKACLNYNFARSCYMYNNPYGTAPIQQGRDVATGMNVLVPTEAQVQELQEDINSIPGCENIDIFAPETPEDFYEYYGYYPDELVNSVWSGNTPEGFEEYYNSLNEDEQNELYAPILFE